MVELHSNFLFQGSKDHGRRRASDRARSCTKPSRSRRASPPGLRPASTSFTTVPNGQGWKWVGDHIRPRVRAPESWHWPVGVSLSTEFGYARPIYLDFRLEPGDSTDCRPANGPAVLVDQSRVREGLYRPRVQAGVGVLARREDLVELHQGRGVRSGVLLLDSGRSAASTQFPYQAQQFVPAFDLDVSPKWEINFGLGRRGHARVPTTCCSRRSSGGASIGASNTRKRKHRSRDGNSPLTAASGNAARTSAP